MADSAIRVIENSDGVGDTRRGGARSSDGNRAGQDIAALWGGDGKATGGGGGDAYYHPDAAIDIPFQTLHRQRNSLRSGGGIADVNDSFGIARTAAANHNGINVVPVEQGRIDGKMRSHLRRGELPTLLAAIDLLLVKFGLV